MPSIINSDDGVSSGTSGLKTTGGNDGILVFQKNGTETARINTDNQIVAAAGTASLPIYSTTGDLNTGIYFPGADRIGFAEGGVQVGEFDASANFKFNSGYGSVATAFGCRAWVNFDGTSNTANLSGTYSQSGTTVTVTATAHGLIVGNVVYSLIGTGTAVSGTYTVATVTDANTFTYTAGTSLTTSGNVTLRRNTIRASGNVSSVADNAVGNYTVNFSTAMPDANYATNITTTPSGGTNTGVLIGNVGTVATTSIQIFVSSAYVAGVYSATAFDIGTICAAIVR